MSDCQGIYSLYFNLDGHSKYHKYILVSRRESTLVYRAGSAIKEVTSSEFYTDGMTINAGNVLNNRFIAQVSIHKISYIRSIHKE